MPDTDQPRLSDSIRRGEDPFAPSTRRGFLRDASALSLAIPAVGSALAACAPGTTSQTDTTKAASREASTPAEDESRRRNSDSKLDTSLLKRGKHGNTSLTGAAEPATEFHRFDPSLPPLGSGPLKIHWHAREAHVRISDDTVVAAWTFEGDV